MTDPVLGPDDLDNTEDDQPDRVPTQPDDDQDSGDQQHETGPPL
jgi:hypothetical protein